MMNFCQKDATTVSPLHLKDEIKAEIAKIRNAMTSLQKARGAGFSAKAARVVEQLIQSHLNSGELNDEAKAELKGLLRTFRAERDKLLALNKGTFDMNTIKQQMNYHAREYRRLKAMDADPMAAIKKHLSAGLAAAKEYGAYEKKFRDAQNKLQSELDGLREIINTNKNKPEVLRAANEAYRKITGM